MDIWEERRQKFNFIDPFKEVNISWHNVICWDYDTFTNLCNIKVGNILQPTGNALKLS